MHSKLIEKDDLDWDLYESLFSNPVSFLSMNSADPVYEIYDLNDIENGRGWVNKKTSKLYKANNDVNRYKNMFTLYLNRIQICVDEATLCYVNLGG